MCQRNLELPVRLMLVGGVLLAFAVLGLFLWGSGRLKNRVDRSQFSSEDVLKAGAIPGLAEPDGAQPDRIQHAEQTTVEHWDGRRWRVSGFIDTRPQPGIKVRTLYFAVVLSNGKGWELEDLQLQSMEFGGEIDGSKELERVR